jgi:hypothetical protein
VGEEERSEPAKYKGESAVRCGINVLVISTSGLDYAQRCPVCNLAPKLLKLIF